MGFETEAIRHNVCAAAGVLFSKSEKPSDVVKMSWSRSTTATEMPGRRIAVRAVFTRRSISAKRGSVADGWAQAVTRERKRKTICFTKNFESGD